MSVKGKTREVTRVLQDLITRYIGLDEGNKEETLVLAQSLLGDKVHGQIVSYAFVSILEGIFTELQDLGTFEGLQTEYTEFIKNCHLQQLYLCGERWLASDVNIARQQISNPILHIEQEESQIAPSEFLLAFSRCTSLGFLSPAVWKALFSILARCPVEEGNRNRFHQTLFSLGSNYALFVLGRKDDNSYQEHSRTIVNEIMKLPLAARNEFDLKRLHDAFKDYPIPEMQNASVVKTDAALREQISKTANSKELMTMPLEELEKFYEQSFRTGGLTPSNTLRRMLVNLNVALGMAKSDPSKAEKLEMILRKAIDFAADYVIRNYTDDNEFDSVLHVLQWIVDQPFAQVREASLQIARRAPYLGVKLYDWTVSDPEMIRRRYTCARMFVRNVVAGLPDPIDIWDDRYATLLLFKQLESLFSKTIPNNVLSNVVIESTKSFADLFLRLRMNDIGLFKSPLHFSINDLDVGSFECNQLFYNISLSVKNIYVYFDDEGNRKKNSKDITQPKVSHLAHVINQHVMFVVEHLPPSKLPQKIEFLRAMLAVILSNEIKLPTQEDSKAMQKLFITLAKAISPSDMVNKNIKLWADPNEPIVLNIIKEAVLELQKENYFPPEQYVVLQGLVPGLKS